ncbi:MAG TPA: hypothetical protein PLI76_10600 [Methanoculleus sp.]|nr:hypothetical protein [Methanoculleus sp.]
MSRSSSTASVPLARAGAGLPKVDLPIALPHALRPGRCRMTGSRCGAGKNPPGDGLARQG